MSVVKWYNKLTHSEEGKALLDYDNFESKTLVVTKEYIQTYIIESIEKKEISHIYAKFRTFREFAHYFKNIPYNHKCFHEVIPGFLPQKPYFDIDVEDISQYDNVNDAIKCLLIAVKEMLPQIKDRDILVFNSNGENKISYHIVIDRWCFLDYRNNKAFVDKVLELLPENYRKFFDIGIYTSLHNFRMFNNHKINSDRVKILDEKSTWIYEIKDKFTEFENFMNILGASLISNASCCNLLPNFYIPNNRKYNITDICLSDDEVDIILECCQKFEKSKVLPYKVVHVKGLLIELKRTAPSFCKVCQRTHENQNPYLTVSFSNGDIKLYCRRSVNNEGIFVGNIIKHNIVEEQKKITGVFVEEEDNIFDENILYEVVKSSSNPSSRKESVNYDDMAKIISDNSKMDLPPLEEKIKKVRKKKDSFIDSEFEYISPPPKNKTKNVDLNYLLEII